VIIISSLVVQRAAVRQRKATHATPVLQQCTRARQQQPAAVLAAALTVCVSGLQSLCSGANQVFRAPSRRLDALVVRQEGWRAREGLVEMLGNGDEHNWWRAQGACR